MKRGFFWFKGFPATLSLMGILLLWAGPALAIDISGTIDDNGIIGQAYLKVMGTGGNDTGLGTTINLDITQDFTIRGLTIDGDYVVAAFIDENGDRVPFGNSARGISNIITVSGGVISGGPAEIVIDYPDVDPTPALSGLDVIPGDGMLLVFVKPERDNQGFYNADEVTLCYGTDPDRANADCDTFDYLPVTGEEIDLALTELTNDEPVYLWATPHLNGEDGTEISASGTPAAPTGGHSVSGSVSFNFDMSIGEPPAGGASVYVALVNDQIPGVQEPTILIKNYIQGDGELSIPFTIEGAPDGFFYVYTLVDLDGNGVFDLGEPKNTERDAPLVEVAGQDLINVNIPVSNAQVTTRVTSQHQLWQNQHNYNLQFEFNDGSRRPTTVTLTGGPQGPLGPMDLGLSQWGNFSIFLPNIGFRPESNLFFTFDITTDGGDDETVHLSASTVLDAFPTSATPSGYTLDTRPDFNWAAPANPPLPFYSYFFQLSTSPTGNYEQLYPPQDFNWDEYLMPSGTTSLAYPLVSDLNYDQQYQTMISLVDRFGNQATISTEFTPVNEIPIQQYTHVGVFRNGTWYLDSNGTAGWQAGLGHQG